MRSLALVLFAAAACGPNKPGALPDAPPVTVDATGVDAPPPVDAEEIASGPVHVVITADNAYSFGYGDANGITHFTQGRRATVAGQIFNCPIGEGPESYEIPEGDAPVGSYLYIVTWDDLSVTQGVIGQFARDTGTVLTGDARFEVCATGLNYASGPDATVGPNQAVINAEIARCNAGTGADTTTSKGWVNANGSVTPGSIGKLAVGETNEDAGGTFPIVCQPTATTEGVLPAAQWMWYDPLDGQSGDAFHSNGTNRFKAFLIFRLAADTIIN